MKILFLGFAKLKIMPYINFYLKAFKEKETDIHIVYWNRDLKEEELNPEYTYYEFKHFQNDNVSKLKKFYPFLKYRKFVKQILKRQEFDRVIVLTTMPAVLLADILKRKFRNNYIFDYRDSTLERYSVFKELVSIVVNNSYATFTSSDGFRRFLPKSSKICTSHNLLLDSLEHRNVRKIQPFEHIPIRIAFWGLLRNININKKIVERLGNDQRFELHYYGRRQSDVFENYCKEKHYNNVYFHGEYKPVDRYDFAANTDIIHNLYNDSNTMLAVGNKLYDGCIFYIPQLCFKGSLMGDIVTTNGIGLAADPFGDDFADSIISYYHSLDREVFNNDCDKYLEKVLNEFNSGLNVINSFLERK